MLVSTAAEALKIDPNDDNEKNKLKQNERHLQIDCGYYLNDFRRLPHCQIYTQEIRLRFNSLLGLNQGVDNSIEVFNQA